MKRLICILVVSLVLSVNGCDRKRAPTTPPADGVLPSEKGPRTPPPPAPPPP